jgi:hypothetical protein
MRAQAPGRSGTSGTKFGPFIGVMTETKGLTARSLIGTQRTYLPSYSRAKRDCRRSGAHAPGSRPRWLIHPHG